MIHFHTSVGGAFIDIITRHRAFDFIICRSPAKLPGAQEFKIEKHDKDRENSDKSE
jgi:hypothetical protein